MSGGFDVAKMKKGHAIFIAKMKIEEARSIAQAGEAADTHVRTKSKFKRRSSGGNSVKDATQYKMIRSHTGTLLRITNSKVVNGYDVSKGLEHGTKPHKIRARNARALRFISRGRVVFAREVNHPGTKPYGFLSKATTHAYRLLGQLLKSRFTKLARKF